MKQNLLAPSLELADLGNVFLVFNHRESLNAEEEEVFLVAQQTFPQKNERVGRIRSHKVLISKERQDNSHVEEVDTEELYYRICPS